MKEQENHLLSQADTIENDSNVDYSDEIVVIAPQCLNENFKSQRNQLWLATHGPGCHKNNSFTGTVHLTHILDCDKMCVHRSEIYGIAKPEVVAQILLEEQKENDFEQDSEEMCQ